MDFNMFAFVFIVLIAMNGLVVYILGSIYNYKGFKYIGLAIMILVILLEIVIF